MLMKRLIIVKRLVFTLFGLVLICSCSSKTVIKLNDFTHANSLEKENLFGPVKELIYYKQKITPDSSDKVNNPIIYRTYKFSDYGKAYYEEYRNDAGDIEEITESIFNDVHLLINRKLRNYRTAANIVETFEYDNENHQLIYKAKVDDNPNHNAMQISTFDDFLNIIKTVSIQLNDTSTTTFDCEYNDQNKVIKKKQTYFGRMSSNEYFYEYKYNPNGDLIEFILKTKENEKVKNIVEYDNENNQKKSSNFIDGVLKEENLYDQFKNPISVRLYKNNELEKESKLEYKYDSHNNWIEKKEFIKDYTKKAVVFTPSIIETREIKYFE